MYTITTVNNKGGVGKTTSSGNFGAKMALTGKKVLLVDTDPQANLTQSFNFYEIESSLHDAYIEFKNKGLDTKAPILKINDNLFILPSSQPLRETEKNLTGYNNNQAVLKNILKPLQEFFDYCIIDCPPSLGMLTDNAVVASNGILIPIEAAQFSLNGVESIVSYLNDLKAHNELKFELIGVFITKFDERKLISFAVRDEINKNFKELVFNTNIRINTELEKSQSDGEDIFMFNLKSNAAIDYDTLTNEIIERINKLEHV